MSNKMKDLRKQLRAVVADILPTFIKEELFAQLQAENRQRMDAIDKAVGEALAEIDKRSRDMQSFAMREIMRVTQPPSKE